MTADNREIVAATLTAALLQHGAVIGEAASLYFDMLNALDAERNRRIKPVQGFDRNPSE